MVNDGLALVTGGAGFIGSHVARRLCREGYRVRVVDNLSTGHRSNLADIRDDIEFIEADLRDPTVCAKAVDRVDTIFHIAALPSVPRSLADPWGSHDCNVNATVRLLIAAGEAGVRRIVYSSSSSAYGNTATLPKCEDSEPLPRSPYAAAKLAGEHYVLAFARSNLIEAVALRYFNVFGPYQDPNSAYAAVIPAFMQAVIDRRPAMIYGDGKQTRDFTYVENVVDANILAATRAAADASGEVVNIGAGAQTSLLDLVELIRDVTSYDLEFATAEPRAGDVQDSLASLDRAVRVLGYAPKVTVREGLERTWTWFQGVNC